MDVATILHPQSVRCEHHVGSKKHALEILSDMLARAAAGPNARRILERLAARERLGSTALGSAVAMPHTRVPELTRGVGAFLRLGVPVEFGAQDGLPVDLIFGLLVPDGSSSAQLAEIREIVKKLRSPTLQDALRATDDPIALHELLTAELTIDRPRPVRHNTGR